MIMQPCSQNILACMRSALIFITFLPFYGFTNEVERISVTAQAQDDLAVSHNSVEQQTLQLLRPVHISEALASQPGVWISRGNGQEHLTAIRSPVLTGAGACGAFLVSEDGIPIRASGFCNANQLFELNSEQAQAIEVFKGPGSSWFGANAQHGIINLVSRPIPQSFEAQTSLETGPNQYRRGSFALGNEHAIAYGNVADDGGYQQSSGYSQYKLNLASQGQLGNWQWLGRLAMTKLDQQTAGYVSGLDAYRDETLRRQNPNPEAYRNAEAIRMSSRFTLALDEDRQWQLTPYLRWQQMDFLQHYVPWQAQEQNGQRSLGLQAQYSHAAGALNWLAGVDLELTDGDLQEYQAQPFSPAIPAGLHYNYHVIATTLSPFININWHLAKNWRLIAGLRYDKQQYDYRNHLPDGDACAEDIANCRFVRPTSQTVSYPQWSPSVALQYQWAPGHQWYTRASRGYRAPQATELFRLQNGQRLAELDSEQLSSLESGVKGNWQGISYNLDLYWMDKRQVIFQDTERQNVSNGHTRHRGLELTLQGDIGQSWYWQGSASLARHTYHNQLKLAEDNIRGNHMDTAPSQQFSAILGWQTDSGNKLELQWQHMGSYYLDPQNSASYPGHSLLHLRAQYALNQRWQLGMRLQNLTNRDYAERADIGFGQYRYFIGLPRSLYLSVSANWSS
ncbi:TonB-dependent receptor [Bowmanella denitrificans]|uniref:TonB-dependent receptor n=1 Tax=Bowmanella denitrificans TaxID=366582 RepID=UPI001FEBA620|nr:TonB-dependent receptor [Bowmanella denitrificans]